MFIYLQTSPETIWQERFHRTIVPTMRFQNMQNKQTNKQKNKTKTEKQGTKKKPVN